MKNNLPLTFTVVSKKGFPFPIDMLRYDMAIPATEVAANKIAETHEPGAKTVGTTVELRYVGVRINLTPERWHSFGWEIQ